MGFLLQRIDIDVVTGDDFGYARYDTALIFHGEAQIPADKSGILGDFKILGIQESRNRSRAGSRLHILVSQYAWLFLIAQSCCPEARS